MMMPAPCPSTISLLLMATAAKTAATMISPSGWKKQKRSKEISHSSLAFDIRHFARNTCGGVSNPTDGSASAQKKKSFPAMMPIIHQNKQGLFYEKPETNQSRQRGDRESSYSS